MLRITAFFSILLMIASVRAMAALQPEAPKPEELEANPPPKYNYFLLNQAGALFHSYNEPMTSLFIFASAVPLSRFFAPEKESDSPLSLIIDVDLKNFRNRTLLGVEYVF